MKKQPGCERLPMRTPPGSCVSSDTTYSPPREFQAAVEKMLVEEGAQKELDGKNLSAE
jgi:hypothetical protein